MPYVKVHEGELNLIWHYFSDNGTVWESMDATAHPYYMTLGVPQCPMKDFTKEHIQFACQAASGATKIFIPGKKPNKAKHKTPTYLEFDSSDGAANLIAQSINANPGFDAKAANWDAWDFLRSKQPGSLKSQ